MPGDESGKVTPELRLSIERALGSQVERATPIGGGDINDAYQVELAGRCRVFVKTNRRAPEGMFAAEAHGLDWLRSSRAISVPEVLAIGSDFLVLEWVEAAQHRRGFDEAFGQQLALLHRSGAASFGLERDNFIGRLHQCNRSSERFSEFLSSERLWPQFHLARRAGHFDSAFTRRFERLVARLDELLGPTEPPARLHGDLWSGNLLVGPEAMPWLIDPAAYGGHREIDLAMMRLFGGFSERVFDAYDEAFPLQLGHEDRVPLMQLYPVLVHVNLFGSGYTAAVRRIVDGYLR